MTLRSIIKDKRTSKNPATRFAAGVCIPSVR